MSCLYRVICILSPPFDDPGLGPFKIPCNCVCVYPVKDPWKWNKSQHWAITWELFQNDNHAGELGGAWCGFRTLCSHSVIIPLTPSLRPGRAWASRCLPNTRQLNEWPKVMEWMSQEQMEDSGAEILEFRQLNYLAQQKVFRWVEEILITELSKGFYQSI